MGFLHDSMDVKVLVLYIMNRVAAPIGYDTLTNLVLDCEEVNYFVLKTEVDGLVDTDHLLLGDDGRYTVTEKGRVNGAAMEDSLSTVIRGKAGRAVGVLNASLRREAQVTARLVDDPDGRCHVELGLADDAGSLFSLSLIAPSKELGQKIVDHYHDQPEDCFNAILALLLQDPEKNQ